MFRFSAKSVLGFIAVNFLVGCASGLPFRDLKPELAKQDGYSPGYEDAKARGGIAGFVPQYCSDGGWGFPSKDCGGSQGSSASVDSNSQSVLAKKDLDEDGIADDSDQCLGTKKGTKVNAFGCAIGEKIEISLNVQFLSGSAEIDAASIGKANQVAQILKDNPEMKIMVEGHTDGTGSPVKNQKLSQERAKAVAQYIISKGASKEQIDSKGYGSSRPIAENTTIAGRKANRRVTAIVQ